MYGIRGFVGGVIVSLAVAVPWAAAGSGSGDGQTSRSVAVALVPGCTDADRPAFPAPDGTACWACPPGTQATGSPDRAQACTWPGGVVGAGLIRLRRGSACSVGRIKAGKDCFVCPARFVFVDALRYLDAKDIRRLYDYGRGCVRLVVPAPTAARIAGRPEPMCPSGAWRTAANGCARCPDGFAASPAAATARAGAGACFTLPGGGDTTGAGAQGPVATLRPSPKPLQAAVATIIGPAAVRRPPPKPTDRGPRSGPGPEPDPDNFVPKPEPNPRR